MNLSQIGLKLCIFYKWYFLGAVPFFSVQSLVSMATYNSEQNPVVSNDLFKNVLVRFTPQRKYTVEIVIVGLLFEVCVPVDYTSASIFRHKFDIFMMMINGLEMADCFG